jgi:hypothetical protein
MQLLNELVNLPVGPLCDQVQNVINFLPGAGALSGFGLAFALPVTTGPDGIPQEIVLSTAKRWHGDTADRFANVNVVTDTLKSHVDTWPMPEGMVTQLNTWRNRIQILIQVCTSYNVSPHDRIERDALLRAAVGYCIHTVKYWAIGEVGAGVLTLDDLHELCFLLPSEHFARERAKETNVVAEVKVSVTNQDFIRVIIDQSAGEDAAKVVRGWPHGVRQALIVIMDQSGKKEVVRQITTHLYNDIKMPEGSHGKQFIVMASFLKHVDDSPKFGNTPTFSMPLTTIDLAAALEDQHQADMKAHAEEVEQHRLEVERLEAEMNKKR